MSFSQTNQIGRDAELDVAMVFLRAGWWVQWRQAYARRDLAVMNSCGVEMLEIKNERAFAGSGNVAIEMLQGTDRRPSGISVSESTICIHYFGEQVFAYRTQKMRLWIRDRRLMPVPFGKSDNHNCGVVVPMDSFIDENWVDHKRLNELPNSHLFKD